MPPNPAALKAELDKPEYAGLDDQQAADALNAEVKVRFAQKVPIGWIQQAALALGKLSAIQNAAGTDPPNPYAVVAAWLWTSSRTDFPPVNMQDAQFQAMLGGLVSTGLITAGDQDAILDLSAVTTTKAKQIAGWGVPVSAVDVNRVRAS